MLKEAIDKIISLAKPPVIEVGDRTFATTQLNELPTEQGVSSFEVNTLTGLLDYIHSNFDTERKMMIHIASPTEIKLFDALNATNDRRTYVTGRALLPRIQFDRLIDREEFQIMLQANFCANPDKNDLTNIISHMTVGDGKTVVDNGATQEVVIKQGVELSTTQLKERYSLMPYRTFVEIEQPPSDFIFRVKDDGEKNIYCGLFEADGGAWELNAMHRIKKYLAENLTEQIAAKKIFIVS